MKIIVFIGNPGAGKTTHISLAFNRLKQLGCPVHRSYIKTVFVVTQLFDKVGLLSWSAWRFAVALDLILNTIILPVIMYLRSILIPSLLGKRVVLIEEDLPGSLVDYIHAAIILNLLPIVRPSLGMFLKLASIGRRLHIVYLYCDKRLLPERWDKRGTPPETNLYVLVQDLVFRIWLKHIDSKISVNTEIDIKSSNDEVVKFIVRSACNK